MGIERGEMVLSRSKRKGREENLRWSWRERPKTAGAEETGDGELELSCDNKAVHLSHGKRFSWLAGGSGPKQGALHWSHSVALLQRLRGTPQDLYGCRRALGAAEPVLLLWAVGSCPLQAKPITEFDT